MQLEEFLNSLIIEDNPEQGNKVELIISESFDPSWLVELAEKEYPEEKWLSENLKNCISKKPFPDDPAMIFLSSSIKNHQVFCF